MASYHHVATSWPAFHDWHTWCNHTACHLEEFMKHPKRCQNAWFHCWLWQFGIWRFVYYKNMADTNYRMHGNIWGSQTFLKRWWWALWSWTLCIQRLPQTHVGHCFQCVLSSDLLLDFPTIWNALLHVQLLFPTTWDTDGAVDETYSVLNTRLETGNIGNKIALFGGDFNASIGTKQACDDVVYVGQCGMAQRNERGPTLAHWVLEHGLQIFNRTRDASIDFDRWTCERTKDNVFVQLDYVIGMPVFVIVFTWNDYQFPIGLDHWCVHCILMVVDSLQGVRHWSWLQNWMPNVDRHGEPQFFESLCVSSSAFIIWGCVGESWWARWHLHSLQPSDLHRLTEKKTDDQLHIQMRENNCPLKSSACIGKSCGLGSPNKYPNNYKIHACGKGWVHWKAIQFEQSRRSTAFRWCFWHVGNFVCWEDSLTKTAGDIRWLHLRPCGKGVHVPEDVLTKLLALMNALLQWSTQGWPLTIDRWRYDEDR